MIDFWMFGCLIFEMMTGKAPFDHKNRKTLFDMINAGCYKLNLIPDPKARDIVSKLLVINPTARLGANGMDGILNHPFFEEIDFKAISKRKAESPLKDLVVLGQMESTVLNPSMDNESSPKLVIENFSWVKKRRLTSYADDDYNYLK